MSDEVFLVHPDAGIGDGEGLLLFIKLKVDARQINAVADERLVLVVDESEMTQLVEGVGGVGDKFAEEDLRVRVKRMYDQLEELAYFSLELLLGHITFIITKNRIGMRWIELDVAERCQREPQVS